MTISLHIPVLLKESLEALKVRPGGRYVDCTLGTGGHTLGMLELAPKVRVLGIDADPEAIELARQRLSSYGQAVVLVNDNFSNLESICSRNDFSPVDGILFDLGLSTLQLESEHRGFSFQREAPLDMRFNPAQRLTAADIVNTFTEKELAQILYEYGQEPHGRQIARRIVENRPITSALQLARVIETAIAGKRGRLHPATRSFQALRIAVNDELANLTIALKQAVDVLSSGGRLVVISYHSLEDRLVKNFLRREASDCICPPETPVCGCGHQATLIVLTKKVITPSTAEEMINPRSHSAKMRVAERTNPAGETLHSGQGSVAQLPRDESGKIKNIIVEPQSKAHFLEGDTAHFPANSLSSKETK